MDKSPAGRPGATPELLVLALQAAVPFRILELQRLSEAERIRLAREASDQIAEHGDVIQYRGGRRGDTARAFNWLATGLACAAFQPGGVRFAGLAWCAAHPQRRWAADEPLCPACLAAEQVPRADAASPR